MKGKKGTTTTTVTYCSKPLSARSVSARTLKPRTDIDMKTQEKMARNRILGESQNCTAITNSAAYKISSTQEYHRASLIQLVFEARRFQSLEFASRGRKMESPDHDQPSQSSLVLTSRNLALLLADIEILMNPRRNHEDLFPHVADEISKLLLFRSSLFLAQ